MDRLLTGDIWKQVNKLNSRGKRIACIAYVTSPTLNLKRGDILIADASDYSIKFQETSAQTLKKYFDKGVLIYSNQQLHSKILLAEEFLVVGSANLSKNSSSNLIESSMLSFNTELQSQAKAFCHQLIRESKPIGISELTRLLSIPLVKRPHKPVRKSKVRNVKLGDGFWFVSTFPLSDRTYNANKDAIEAGRNAASADSSVDVEDISFIRWQLSSKFAKEVLPGDQLFVRSRNENNTRSHLYSASTVLRKERQGNYALIYHDETNLENIPWTSFSNFAKRVDLNKCNNRTIRLTKQDAEIIESVWA